ncbi:MAG: hypothetical protein JST39_09470 [Bacteroidetes bacterium]|nr:hypothetical protein [Bacteroidota bacterium]
MKTILSGICMAITISAAAQVSDNRATMPVLTFGSSYVHDFPGLNGFAAHAEFGFPIAGFAMLETGIKRIQASGNPRTAGIKEYTKATTFDFNLLFVPLGNDRNALKVGGGYSFVFYNLRRSDPVYDGGKEASGWVQQDSRSMTSGCSLIGVYEYYFSEKISAGARVSLAKAYAKHVWMGGPFIAVKL